MAAGGRELLPAGRELIGRLRLGASEIERVKRLSQRSPEWFRHRRLRLTASAFPVVAGRNAERRRSHVQTMLRGWVPDNEHMAYGRWFEGHAISEYVAATGATLLRPGLCVVPETPWLAVSPDAVVLEPGAIGLLEVKCPSRRGNDSLDNYCGQYMDQIQGSMGLLRLDWCDFLMWSPQSGARIKRVKYSEEYFRRLLDTLRRFYFFEFVPEAVKRPDAAPLAASSPRNAWPVLPPQDALLAAAPTVASETLRRSSDRLRKSFRSPFSEATCSETLGAPARLLDSDRILFVTTEGPHLALSLMSRPAKVFLVAGQTYELRGLLRGLDFKYSPYWRGWWKSADCSDGEAQIACLITELKKAVSETFVAG